MTYDFCPLCGSKNFTYEASIITHSEDYYHCNSCGLYFNYGSFYSVEYTFLIDENIIIKFARRPNYECHKVGIYAIISTHIIYFGMSDFIEFVKKYNTKNKLEKFISLL